MSQQGSVIPGMGVRDGEGSGVAPASVAEMTEGQRSLLPESTRESSEEDKKVRSLNVVFKGPGGCSSHYQVTGHLGLKVKGVLDKDFAGEVIYP